MTIIIPTIAGTEIAGHGEDGIATIIITLGGGTVLATAVHGDIIIHGITTVTMGIMITTVAMVATVVTVAIMDQMFTARLHGVEDIIIIQ